MIILTGTCKILNFWFKLCCVISYNNICQKYIFKNIHGSKLTVLPFKECLASKQPLPRAVPIQKGVTL